MAVAELMNRPATLIQRRSSATANDYGDEVPDEASSSIVVELQQRTASESEDDLSEASWIAFLPAGTPVGTGDALYVEDEGEFEVVGDPWNARNPRTRAISHIEARLKRTAGPETGS